VGEVRLSTVRWWIERFVAGYGLGRLSRWWRKPLVGVASADDELFKLFKRLHGLVEPAELLKGARSVVVVFLPFAEWVSRSNEDGLYASREWARSYLEANRLLTKLSERLANWLSSEGFKAVGLCPTGEFNQEELKSSWSHRHAAYVAGLGTLGAHGLLITRLGCCGRLTSILTTAPLRLSQRPPEEYCLFKRGLRCLKCVDKCSWGALKISGLDKERCYEACLANAKLYRELDHPDVCGKCSCGVPCSLEKPVFSTRGLDHPSSPSRRPSP